MAASLRSGTGALTSIADILDRRSLHPTQPEVAGPMRPQASPDASCLITIGSRASENETLTETAYLSVNERAVQ